LLAFVFLADLDTVSKIAFHQLKIRAGRQNQQLIAKPLVLQLAAGESDET
jgi:hypothetical protein